MEAIQVLDLIPQIGISGIVTALLIWLQNKSSKRVDDLEKRIERKDDQLIAVVKDYKDVSHSLSDSLEKNSEALQQNTKMTERVYELLTKQLQ